MYPITLPPKLLLEINHQCNYHCPWCYCVWHEEPDRKIRNLPIGVWKKIIVCAVTEGVRAFIFSGGEATMRKGWQELLRFTRHQLPDGELSLFTNGSRFSEQDLLGRGRKKDSPTLKNSTRIKRSRQ